MNELNKQCPYLEENCDATNCNCAKYKAYEKVNTPGEIEKELAKMGFGDITDPWLLLMSMQKLFASRFHKIENLEKSEIDYWTDKYLICIDDEIREVREHLHIYPDDEKIPKNNIIELKKEVIDILHFVMDLFLVGNADGEIIKKHYIAKYDPEMIDKEIHNFIEYAWDSQKYQLTDFYDVHNDLDINLIATKLQDSHSKVRQLISWKHWKKPSIKINMENLWNAHAEVFKCLIDLFIITGMEPEEIKDVYIKKNIENVFRQNEGY